MSRQDKATTERNAKVLRELVKRPENKVCADCKRNDPRWASWNIGVFICIRCSGIHRSMGTHISKVKSVDLDIWTPEQMQSIQKWGNHRANLYWEAHLKPGHIPPDHKMESFIRSKYESRRWALDGPPPDDPSVLEKESTLGPTLGPTEPVGTQPLSVAKSARPAAIIEPVPSSVTPSIPRPPSHILMSSSLPTARRDTPSTPQVATTASQQGAGSAQPSASSKPGDDLFSLDFHSPPSSTAVPNTMKDIKTDILSLFGTGSPTVSNSVPATSSVSLANSQGPAMWGAHPIHPNSALAFTAHTSTSVPQTDQSGMFGADIWSGQADPFAPFGSSTAPSAPQRKNDAFSDLWGDFK